MGAFSLAARAVTAEQARQGFAGALGALCSTRRLNRPDPKTFDPVHASRATTCRDSEA
jgi:hypothetical protein